jgi:hypothetical protein
VSAIQEKMEVYQDSLDAIWEKIAGNQEKMKQRWGAAKKKLRQR